MSSGDDFTVKQALDGAANAIKRGDLETGKAGLKWVLEREPDNVLAWLWMSRCTESSEAKVECFNRVLAVDPANKHALKGLQMFGGEGKSQESPLVPLESSTAPAIQDSPLQKIHPVLKDSSRAMVERLRPILKKPAARLALFAVGALFLIVACGFAIGGIGGGGGSGSSSTSPSRSPVIANTCPSGFFSMEEDDKLYKNVDSGSDDYGAYYHVIPAGDPVGATGRCSGNYAEVMHQGDTGWVFKHKID